MNKTRHWFRLKRHPQLKRFFQGTGEQQEPYLTNGRNVYILPTKSGLAFAIILLVMLVGAINYNNSLGYLFTFFLASLSIVAILHTYRNVLRLQIKMGKPRSVFSGETAMVPLFLNQQHTESRYALHMFFDREKSKTLNDINSLHIEIQLPLQTHQRGLHKVPRFILASTFPLGLFRSWSHIHLSQTFIVFPKPAQHAPDLPSTSYLPEQEGDQGKGTDDFSGLRNYHNGDSLRHVHWKAFAKQGTMITKQFGGDRSNETWLDWDKLPETSLENKLSILTRWVINAEKNEITYGLKIPGHIINPSSGPPHCDQCLETLALFDLKNV